VAHYCGETAAWINIPLGTEVGVGVRDIVLAGDPALRPLKGHNPPIFGQCPFWPSGRWTKMLLGMKLGLGPGDFVFDRDPATPKRAHPPNPIFGPRLLWPNGWRDQDATWYGGKRRLR